MIPNEIDQKLIFIEKAIKLLEASKAKFKVIYGEHEFGDLEVVQEKKIIKRHRFFADKYDYVTIMRSLDVGDVHVFNVSEEDSHGLTSSICARAITIWGKGSVATQNDGSKVTIMRLI
jgi:hypothetical protein